MAANNGCPPWNTDEECSDLVKDAALTVAKGMREYRDKGFDYKTAALLTHLVDGRPGWITEQQWRVEVGKALAELDQR